MRFMIIVKSNPRIEAGELPGSDEIAAIGRFSEAMIDAGILLAAEGLQPSRNGKRIRFEAGGGQTLLDGPFAEAKELIGGFWMIDVASMDEAMAWARRAPMNPGSELEVRPLFEAANFEANDITREHLRKEQAFRDATIKPITRSGRRTTCSSWLFARPTPRPRPA